MSHDPLCPAYTPAHPDRDWNTWRCMCHLIDRVRADERRAARDAVAALRGVDIRLDISRLTINWTGEYQKFIVSADALAAIDALRGEPDE